MARLVYGLHPVRELLRRRPRAIQGLWLARSDGRGARPEVAELADEQGVQPLPATAEQLSALCGNASHQGVVAVVGDYPYRPLEDLLGDELPLLLAVDGVTDPQNLGAMLRSALVLGVTGVVLTKDRCAGINPAVVRVSSGATEHLRCARVTNLVRALDQLKEAGLWVAGTVERGGAAPADADLDLPLALVLGNEQRGLRKLVRERCDLLLTIPAGGAIGALNVAAATSVICYEVARQRRQARDDPPAARVTRKR